MGSLSHLQHPRHADSSPSLSRKALPHTAPMRNSCPTWPFSCCSPTSNTQRFCCASSSPPRKANQNPLCSLTSPLQAYVDCCAAQAHHGDATVPCSLSALWNKWLPRGQPLQERQEKGAAQPCSAVPRAHPRAVHLHDTERNPATHTARPTLLGPGLRV